MDRIDRIDRIRDKLADLDLYARDRWAEAPSYRLSAPLDEAAVAEVEARIGVRLPDDYRGFVSRIGSAGPGPDYGLSGLDPAQSQMPREMPSVTSTITTVDGQTFSAGTGPRAPQARDPDAARPFPLAAAWSPVDRGVMVPPPIAPDAHLYDGSIMLGEIGCGYFYFLVVSGPDTGRVWCDYSAGDGSIAPLAGFLDWYETWLDDVVCGLLGGAVRDALDRREPSPLDPYIQRWSSAFEAQAARAAATRFDRAALAQLRLYQGRRDEAAAASAALDAELGFADDPATDQLDRWLHREALTAATGDPPRVAEALAAPSWRVRRALAMNPAATSDALAALIADARHEVRRAAVRTPGCPPAALGDLAIDAEARWRDGAADALEPLYELDAVARHPATPAAVLDRLASLPARHRDRPLATAIARGVAINAACPAALLEHLADAAAPWVRAAVAAHPATTATTATRLAGDPHFAVRAAVAGRDDVDAEVLATLARDRVAQVRAAAAAHPRTPSDALRRLACDRDSTVAWALAANRELPDDALDLIADHPAEPIRDGRRPASTTEPPVDDPFVAMSKSPKAPLCDVIRGAQYRHASYPPALLPAVFADPEPLPGYEAASSPWLDDALVELAATHHYSYARSQVADHPAASDAVRARLVRDRDPMVARDASPTVALDGAALAELAADGHEDRRRAAADNPGASAELLVSLADDPAPWVRRAVMTNPRAPLDVALTIARDPEPAIRRFAPLRDDLPADAIAALEADADAGVARAARYARKRAAMLARLA